MCEWISVNDRLPNDCKTVLVLTIIIPNNNHGKFITRVNQASYYRNGWEVYDGIVTHWMPLPELPTTFTLKA